MDLKSKEGVDKFISENFSEMLNSITETYSPVLIEELIERIKFTINEFNEEMSSVFNQLKIKEKNRQKMYKMIKDGNLTKEDGSSEKISKEWEEKINDIES